MWKGCKWVKVLVACEESQTVCKAFRERGHEAYSADIVEPSGGHPEWHVLGDVLPIINGNCTFTTMDGTQHQIEGTWDLLIAHPPCTYLSIAGNRVWNAPGREEKRQQAFAFFMAFINAKCKKIVVENPVGYVNSHFRKPDQIIHPYYFGDPWLKKTCLWLKGVPVLHPSHMLPKPEPVYICFNGKKLYSTEGMKHTKDRAKNRSKTAPGIAAAMADQWGKLV